MNGQRKHSALRLAVGDAVGLITVLLMILLGARFTSRIDFTAWCLAYLFVAVPMAGMWHIDKSPLVSRSRCLQATGWSVVCGMGFMIVDLIVGHFSHPELPIFQAATTDSGPLGFGFTIIVCPAAMLMAIGSLVRVLAIGDQPNGDA